MRIAALQGQESFELEVTIKKIESYAQVGEASNAQILCFPECFITGYSTDKTQAQKLALDISNPIFLQFLSCLKPFDITLILGLMERSDNELFNTALVIRKGKVIGKYRKQNLLGRERFFTPGSESPIFEVMGMKFGVLICSDSNKGNYYKKIREQGGQGVFCLANNMLPIEIAEKWRDKHNEIRAQKCLENQLWMISSDVTGERPGSLALGPTAFINAKGKIVKQLPLGQNEMLIQELPNGFNETIPH